MVHVQKRKHFGNQIPKACHFALVQICVVCSEVCFTQFRQQVKVFNFLFAKGYYCSLEQKGKGGVPISLKAT